MNKVILKGRITQDLELRTTINNKPVVRFTLAVNEGYGEGQRTNFINCEVWNKLAENLHKYCEKGSLLLLEGSIRVESYDGQDGQKKYVTKVLVQNIEYLDNKKKDSTENIANYLQSSAENSAEESVSSIYTDEVEIEDDDIPWLKEE